MTNFAGNRVISHTVDLVRRLHVRHCCRAEPRNAFQFLHGRGKRVGQAPHRPRCELLVLRIEIAIVHDSGEVFGHLQVSLDKSLLSSEADRNYRSR